MMTFKYSAVLSAALFAAQPASANWFEDLGNDLVDVAEGTLEMTGIPAGVRMLEGDDPKEAIETGIDNVKNAAIAGTRLPTHSPIPELESRVIEDVAGKDVATIHRVTRAPTRIAERMPERVMQWLIDTSENIDNADDIVGLPLAAALQQAYDHFDGSASPLPKSIKDQLSVYFPDEAIGNARYVVSNDPDTLNGLINMLQQEMGDTAGQNHAVVTGNIIVFAHMPATDSSDIEFWAHELVHTIQYERMGGFNGFAQAYLTGYAEIEEEAHREARNAVNKLHDLALAMTGGQS